MRDLEYAEYLKGMGLRRLASEYRQADGRWADLVAAEFDRRDAELAALRTEVGRLRGCASVAGAPRVVRTPKRDPSEPGPIPDMLRAGRLSLPDLVQEYAEVGPTGSPLAGVLWDEINHRAREYDRMRGAETTRLLEERARRSADADLSSPQETAGANAVQHGGTHYRKVEGEQHWDRIWRLFGPEVAWVYFVGNATAYIERYRDKNGVEDLRKAGHFIQKLIELEESTPAKGKCPRCNQDVLIRVGKEQRTPLCRECSEDGPVYHATTEDK